MSYTQGREMYSWMLELFDHSRSIAGPGIEHALSFVADKIHVAGTRHTYKTGTSCGDWIVPPSWDLHRGSISDSEGNIIVSSQDSNLHVWSHSKAVSGWFDAAELRDHLLTHPSLPNAIPYATTYYHDNWGFSVTWAQAQRLGNGRFQVEIDATITEGQVALLDVLVPGTRSEEILFSTYLCHPSMANDGLSGPMMAIQLINWLDQRDELNYSYRFIFGPETIGPICYLSRHVEQLRHRVWSAWNLTCLGDDNSWSLLPSVYGDSVSDKIARYVLEASPFSYHEYSFVDRGSDERQYSCPGVQLPMVSIMRSKYHEYPEYHTSLDDLNFVSTTGLQASFDIFTSLLQLLDREGRYFSTTVGEPMLSKYVDYPSLGGRTPDYGKAEWKDVWNIVALSTGRTSIQIAQELELDLPYVQDLLANCRSWGIVRFEPVTPPTRLMP